MERKRHRCTRCGKPKASAAYAKDGSLGRGRRIICRDCVNAERRVARKTPEGGKKERRYRATYLSKPGVQKARKEYNKQHRGDGTYLRFYHLKRTYGLTVEELGQMLEKQKGGCGICGVEMTKGRSKTSMVVDHDHETMKVRGLLCRGCNTGIGMFGDSKIILKAALHYLDG